MSVCEGGCLVVFVFFKKNHGEVAWHLSLRVQSLDFILISLLVDNL